MDGIRAREFADEFGLTFLGVGWGRINGNGRRIEEFVRVWNDRQMWRDADLADEVVDLIVACANDRLLAGSALLADETAGVAAVIEDAAGLPYVRLDKWLSLAGSADFPIAELVSRWAGPVKRST